LVSAVVDMDMLLLMMMVVTIESMMSIGVKYSENKMDILYLYNSFYQFE